MWKKSIPHLVTLIYLWPCYTVILFDRYTFTVGARYPNLIVAHTRHWGRQIARWCRFCLVALYSPWLRFVSVYNVGRRYGGPEEGGWYYDCYMPVSTRPVLRFRARVLQARLRAEHEPHAGRRNWYAVYVEKTPYENMTRNRPHYE